MTFDDFEKVVLREIKNFLNGTNMSSSYNKIQYLDNLILKWRSNEDTASVRFVIALNRKTWDISFVLDVMFETGDSEDDIYDRCEFEMPQSEEEHFQMSTTKDIGFSWEFYEYLSEVLWKLRNK
jgi:hypothetical protein